MSVPRFLTSTAKQAANWERKALVAPYLERGRERILVKKERERRGEGGREESTYVHGGKGRGHIAGDGGGEDDAAWQLFLRREGGKEKGREREMSGTFLLYGKR